MMVVVHAVYVVVGTVGEIRQSGASLEAMSGRLYASVERFRRGGQRFVEE